MTAARFAAMAREFPDFDQSTLPAIPAGFEDESWHNDACPSFYSEALQLRLWVDYAKPEERETFSGGRFTLQHEPRTDGVIDGEASDLVSSDEWSDVLAHILAAAFASELRAELTPEQWAEMCAANVGADPMTCASHDYCDANMPMAAAFEKVTGREPFTSWETNPDGSPCDPAEELQAQTDCALWNAAWDIAKPRYLTAETLPLGGDLDALAAIFASWTAREGLTDGDAMELLMGDVTPEQREWLSAFVVLWDAEQTRIDTAKES